MISYPVADSFMGPGGDAEPVTFAIEVWLKYALPIACHSSCCSQSSIVTRRSAEAR